MRAVHLPAFGDPTEVPAYVNIPEPAQPAAGQVLIEVLYAPVNHNDLLVMGGNFPYHPELPAVLGNEAVGRVLALGDGVTNVRQGDLVTPPLYSGTWRERMLVQADELFALPPDADALQLSMIRINPLTAGLMLSEYVDLQPGDWIVQNAANSGVGRAAIALAKARGLRSINLVRRPELIPEIQAAGGDVVLLDEPGAAAKAAALIGNGKVRLALDGVSGASTARLIEFLSPGAALVAYAMMSGEKVAPGDLMPLMFKSISSHFFYQNRPQYRSKIPALLREAAQMVAAGQLHTPVARTYALSEVADAIAHTLAGGKVLLAPQTN
ncbi:alcohol dehydrogenase catalytic domain-containing protein [Pseudoduganella sp. FT25W]|jgi:NADPH:quinone reductase-like Zn-dependent oxidoreductase|uniref:enoyl-[acyl-carrier-protein] reductase n=1 Tax=Duganella alba TaxID=2666081 RepID=A0A6L5QBF1_9BURK|nr:zinc-dependent alcohol dehydrogenase family protein [Duganella alba]MRX06642.1 alcohol dehydrogenase catalytic domain-containing protein [Duganella alba]MRX18008.1 alcohol dehydrogenase catalytic domain-containing protein [Duganella alba]